MWTNTKESLRDSLGASAFSLWIEPIRCRNITDASVLLICPDKFFAVHVARHFQQAIEEAASSTAGRPLKADLLVEPQERRLVAFQQPTTPKEQHANREQLNELSLRQQFALLWKAHPRKTGVQWFAWKEFSKLYNPRQRKRADVNMPSPPDFFELLQIHRQEKTSADWNQDGGRWVPGLARWLKGKPWWSNGCKERREEPKTIAAQ